MFPAIHLDDIAVIFRAEFWPFCQRLDRWNSLEAAEYAILLRPQWSGSNAVLIFLKDEPAPLFRKARMAQVDELREMAHRLYARARRSSDPLTKRMLMEQADDLLKEAAQLRAASVFQAAYPKADRKFG